MPNANNVTVNTEHMKIFLVGDYGTGKSVFASTCPTPGFLFDNDSGVLTYRDKDWDYEQFSLAPQGWVKFEKVLRELKEKFKENPDCYKTVVLDSTSTMSDIAMERSLQLDPKRSATNGPLWNVHYQMVRNLMEGKLRQIVDLPANVVMIAHLKVIQDQETGAILGTEPLLTGQLSTIIPGYFNEVYCSFAKTEGGETKYIIRTAPKGHYKARSRISGVTHIIPDEIPNTYAALMESIKEGGKTK